MCPNPYPLRALHDPARGCSDTRGTPLVSPRIDHSASDLSAAVLAIWLCSVDDLAFLHTPYLPGAHPSTLCEDHSLLSAESPRDDPELCGHHSRCGAYPGRSSTGRPAGSQTSGARMKRGATPSYRTKFPRSITLNPRRSRGAARRVDTARRFAAWAGFGGWGRAASEGGSQSAPPVVGRGGAGEAAHQTRLGLQSGRVTHRRGETNLPCRKRWRSGSCGGSFRRGRKSRGKTAVSGRAEALAQER